MFFSGSHPSSAMSETEMYRISYFKYTQSPLQVDEIDRPNQGQEIYKRSKQYWQHHAAQGNTTKEKPCGFGPQGLQKSKLGNYDLFLNNASAASYIS